jgi:hypothetical protein
MRKSIISMFVFLIMLLGTKVYAAGTIEVEPAISGKVEKGETIQILINIKDIKSLYAGDIEFRYDPSVLKLKGIELGELITKPGIGKFDAINKVDEQNGIARYAFSCFGQVNGFSGGGTLIKLNAEVLKKEDIRINSKPLLKAPEGEYNLKLQLCDSNVKELEYTFKSLNQKVPESKPVENKPVENKPVENKPADNQGSTGNTNTNNAAANNTSTNTNNTNTNTAPLQNNTEQKPETKPTEGAQQQQNSTAENTEVKTVEQVESKSSSTVIIGLLLLAVGGAGAYFVWKKKQSNKNLNV